VVTGQVINLSRYVGIKVFELIVFVWNGGRGKNQKGTSLSSGNCDELDVSFLICFPNTMKYNRYAQHSLVVVIR
jgi:hypothetical protein